MALDQLRSDEHGIAACKKALRIWEARLRGRFWGLPLLVVLGLVLGFGFRVFFSPAMQSLGPPSCATRRSQTAKPQAFCTVSVLWDTFTPLFAAFTTRKTKTNALQSPLGRCWSHVFSARMRPCLGHGSRGGGGGRRGTCSQEAPGRGSPSPRSPGSKTSPRKKKRARARASGRVLVAPGLRILRASASRVLPGTGSATQRSKSESPSSSQRHTPHYTSEADRSASSQTRSTEPLATSSPELSF